MLNRGGATRFSSINDSLTHIVVGQPVPSHVEEIEQLDARPHIVAVQWLLESARAGQSVDELLFPPEGFNIEGAMDDCQTPVAWFVKK